MRTPFFQVRPITDASIAGLTLQFGPEFNTTASAAGATVRYGNAVVRKLFT